jgi:hypothetical protein
VPGDQIAIVRRRDSKFKMRRPEHCETEVNTPKVEDYGSILEMSSLRSSVSTRLYLLVATLEDHVSPEVERIREAFQVSD